MLQMRPQAFRGRDRIPPGGSKKAADFGPAIVGVKVALTLVHSELCSFSAKPSLYFSVSWTCSEDLSFSSTH